MYFKIIVIFCQIMLNSITVATLGPTLLTPLQLALLRLLQLCTTYIVPSMPYATQYMQTLSKASKSKRVKYMRQEKISEIILQLEDLFFQRLLTDDSTVKATTTS